MRDSLEADMTGISLPASCQCAIVSDFCCASMMDAVSYPVPGEMWWCRGQAEVRGGGFLVGPDRVQLLQGSGGQQVCTGDSVTESLHV